MEKIINYYHIGCFHPLVTPILDEYFTALKNIDVPIDLRIGLVGTVADCDKVIQQLYSYGRSFKVVASAEEGWEQLTLNEMHQDSLNSQTDKYILYTHSKGSFNPQVISPAWRSQMLWWNVVNWRSACKHLYEGADAVGIHLMQGLPYQPRIFGGNFWWSKESIIRQLPICKDNDRWDAELWIGLIETLKKDAKLVDLHPSPIGAAYPDMSLLDTGDNHG